MHSSNQEWKKPLRFYLLSSSNHFENTTIVTEGDKDDIKIMATYYMMYKVGKLSYYFKLSKF